MGEEQYPDWPNWSTGILQQVADALFALGAIKFGAFRLKLHEKNPDAPLSPIYVNLRLLRSCPDAMKGVVKIFRDMSRGLQFDCYADVPTAATPIVAVLSYLTHIPMITPRKAKTHGAPGTIDGAFREGQTALLVDDLVTRADSKLEAIQVLERNGVKVQDVMVLVDLEQGGRERLKEAGYRLHTASRLSTLLRWYLNTGKIGQARYEEVMAYLAANK